MKTQSSDYPADAIELMAIALHEEVQRDLPRFTHLDWRELFEHTQMVFRLRVWKRIGFVPDADDPMVLVDREQLMKLVSERTPFTMAEFERLLAWDFRKDAPLSRKKLAWEVLSQSKESLRRIKAAMDCFPRANVLRFHDLFDQPNADNS